MIVRDRFIIFSMLLISVAPVYGDVAFEPKPFDHGWSFRHAPDAEWRTFSEAFGEDRLRPLPIPEGRELFLRVPVPVTSCRDPALYLSFVNQSFTVYHEREDSREVVYRFGDVERGAAGYAGWPFHLISLPKSAGRLIFHIYSGAPTAGIAGTPRLGCRDELLHEIVQQDVDRFVAGVLILVTALFVLFLYVRRRSLERIHLAFVFLCLAAGLYLISNRTLRLQYVVAFAPGAWLFLEYTSLYFLPATIAWYFYQVVPSRFVRFFVGFAVVTALVFWLLEVSGLVRFYASLTLFFYTLLFSALALFAVIVRAALQGNREARWIAGGIGIFTAVAIYDLLGVLGFYAWPKQMLTYGFVGLLLCMAMVVSRRYDQVQQRLREYSRELEDARARLEDHAQNLEGEVERRTRELRESLAEVRRLKEQQDGDYFLIGRLMRPLARPRSTIELKVGRITVAHRVEQKKRFEFKDWKDQEIGGDLCMADVLRLGDGSGQEYLALLNADAMGKSMQGAGGAIVLGVAYQAIVNRTRAGDAAGSPVEWLRDAYAELHRTFLPFEGGMLASFVLMLIRISTAEVYAINAEHPNTVLLRDGNASFLELPLSLRKIGAPDALDLPGVSFEDLHIEPVQLEPGDILVAGSDGRDDLALGAGDEHGRMIDSDEQRFLEVVAECHGDIEAIIRRLQTIGRITDDLSLMKIEYKI